MKLVWIHLVPIVCVFLWSSSPVPGAHPWHAPDSSFPRQEDISELSVGHSGSILPQCALIGSESPVSGSFNGLRMATVLNCIIVVWDGNGELKTEGL